MSSSRAARRIRRNRIIAAGSAAAAITLFAPVVADAGTYNAYVSLGDSYASGPVIPTQVDTSCTRSDHNYPSLVAKTVAPGSFTDMSCGGATTVDMTQPQSGTDNPPQFNGLSQQTDLVTLTIGGNDINFAGIVLNCASMGATQPTGTPCTNYYNSGGADQISQAIDRTAPKVAAVLQGIHQHSPKARVLVVGYLDILPQSGSCYSPNNTIAPGDYPYLNAKEQQLNQMISTEAGANSARFVDTFNPTIGHDLCKAPGTRWVEGLFPTAPAAPVHPNELGMQADSTQVLTALGS